MRMFVTVVGVIVPLMVDVIVVVMVLMAVTVARIMIVGMDVKLRRRHPRAQHAFGVNVTPVDHQAAQRRAQIVERQTGVEQRAERHVPGDAREAVEVQNAAHIRSITAGPFP
jgi:hypothetical protein